MSTTASYNDVLFNALATLVADGYIVIESEPSERMFNVVAVPTVTIDPGGELPIRLIKIATPGLELHEHGRLAAMRQRFPQKTISVEAWVYHGDTVHPTIEVVK